MNSYAGFWIRTKAFALDYFVVLAYMIFLAAIFLLVGQASSFFLQLFATRISAQPSGFLLLTLPISLYFAISESSIRRGTWGKQRMNLAVVNQLGNRISIPGSFTRTLLKFIPWELSHTLVWEIYFHPDTESVFINYGFVLVYVLLGLNLASLAFSRSHRTLYDFIAGTFVVAGDEF